MTLAVNYYYPVIYYWMKKENHKMLYKIMKNTHTWHNPLLAELNIIFIIALNINVGQSWGLCPTCGNLWINWLCERKLELI